jgi:hypothetical protein
MHGRAAAPGPPVPFGHRRPSEIAALPGNHLAEIRDAEQAK